MKPTIKGALNRLGWFVIILGAVIIGLKIWGALFELGLPSDEDKARSQALGTAFGADHTQDECLLESLRLIAECQDDSKCEFGGVDFIRSCLPASKPTAGFCDGVPSNGLKDVIKGQEWSSRVWKARGSPHHGGRALDAVRTFCHPWNKGS